MELQVIIVVYMFFFCARVSTLNECLEVEFMTVGLGDDINISKFGWFLGLSFRVKFPKVYLTALRDNLSTPFWNTTYCSKLI